jgi:hypothetical protein
MSDQSPGNDDESELDLPPPPRKSDVLFGSAPGGRVSASVNGMDGSIAYQDGYRRAAFLLAEHVCEMEREQHFLIYPIVYLYRHHIELTLKSIIKVASFLLDYTLTDKYIDTLSCHDLNRLWQLARPMLNPVSGLGGLPALPVDDLEGIDSYIGQLHKHDPDGQRFRYFLVKAKGQKVASVPSLHPTLQKIDIRNFAIAMEKLADYLEGIDNWFGDLIEAKAAYRSQQP